MGLSPCQAGQARVLLKTLKLCQLEPQRQEARRRQGPVPPADGWETIPSVTSFYHRNQIQAKLKGKFVDKLLVYFITDLEFAAFLVLHKHALKKKSS